MVLTILTTINLHNGKVGDIDKLNDVDSDAPTGINASSPSSYTPRILSSNFYEISTDPTSQQNVFLPKLQMLLMFQNQS